MKGFYSYALASLLLLCSCGKTMQDNAVTGYMIEIDVQYTQLYDVPKVGREPKQFRVNFYDPESGHLVTTNIINGSKGYLYNLHPGTYDVLVFDNTSNKTNVAGEREYTGIVASTAVYSYGEYPSVESPDHLYLYRQQGVVVPQETESGGVWVFHARPESVVQNWLLYIDGIKGLENADNINCYLSGQSGACLLGMGTPAQKEVTIFFPVYPNPAKGVIESPFNTFGKMEGKEAVLTLNLLITGSGGEGYICQTDVTSQFLDPDNTEKIIRAHFDLVIKERQDGGFNPTTDPWDDIAEDINIK